MTAESRGRMKSSHNDRSFVGAEVELADETPRATAALSAAVVMRRRGNSIRYPGRQLRVSRGAASRGADRCAVARGSAATGSPLCFASTWAGDVNKCMIHEYI
jgi:hypothetical protein